MSNIYSLYIDRIPQDDEHRVYRDFVETLLRQTREYFPAVSIEATFIEVAQHCYMGEEDA